MMGVNLIVKCWSAINYNLLWILLNIINNL